MTISITLKLRDGSLVSGSVDEEGAASIKESLQEENGLLEITKTRTRETVYVRTAHIMSASFVDEASIPETRDPRAAPPNVPDVRNQDPRSSRGRFT